MSRDAENVVDLYRRHAEAWTTARAAARVVEKPWLDRFKALLPPGASILDLGCGSGVPIARYFVDHGFSLTGVTALRK